MWKPSVVWFGYFLESPISNSTLALLCSAAYFSLANSSSILLTSNSFFLNSAFCEYLLANISMQTTCYSDAWSSFLVDLHNLILATFSENKIFSCISEKGILSFVCNMLQLLYFNVFEKTILVLNWVRYVFNHVDFFLPMNTMLATQINRRICSAGNWIWMCYSYV